MAPEPAPAAAAVVPAPPRWVFRGDDDALDALATSVAADPAAPVAWPIAPSGPSMGPGEGVLLWRSGRGGGVVAACTVLDEPVASVAPDGAPRVTVDLRIDRAFGRPLAPADLLDEPVLRPLAFLDLHDLTELRLADAQRDALARTIAARDGAAADPEDEEVVLLHVPRRLAPVVAELLARLGADEPPPRRTSAPVEPRPRAGAGGPPPEPSDLQRRQAGEVAAAHGDDGFTVDEVAATWRTGVGTARSRIERLVEVGLVERAGTRRAAGAGPATRGRPPVLYRLAPAGHGAPEVR